MEATKPIHVVGMGSPHGDDQVGWQAIAYLQQSSTFQQTCGNRVALYTCETPLDGFLERAKESQTLIVIDAVVAGSVPGTIMRLTEDNLPKTCFPSSSHGYGVAQMITLGRAMNMLPSHLVVIGVEINEAKPGEPLGAWLALAFKQLEKLVVDEIENTRV